MRKSSPVEKMSIALRRCCALEKVDGSFDDGNGHEGGDGHDDE